MKDIEKIKCSKCGFLNVKGSSKCAKCGNVIKNYVSCPKCAKKNKVNAKICVNCGYKFRQKKKSLLINLVISLLIVAFLFLLLTLEFTNVVSNITKGFKFISVILIFILLYTSINYGKKEITNYTAEEELIDDNKKVKKMKTFSNIMIVIGAIIVFVFLVYYCFYA